MMKKKKPTGQSKKSSNTRKNAAHDDSDIEVIEGPENEKETPENERGTWSWKIIKLVNDLE